MPSDPVLTLPSFYPPILAIETSHRLGSIALSQNNYVYSVPLEPDFGQFLVSQIQTLLTQHQLVLKNLALIVLGAGPGSYTGLRIGFAVGLTLARFNQIPIRTVESTRAIACNYTGNANEIAVALDARQNEFYFATYQKHHHLWFPATPITVCTQIQTSLPCLGDAHPPLSEPQGIPPKAEHLLQLGFYDFQKEGAQPIESIAPLYLRPTEAERKLQKKILSSPP